MSKTKNFFDEQGDGTAVKVQFYNDYVSQYLIRLLMEFGFCFVADLFCGNGKNGSENGSPLILLEKVKIFLQNSTLLRKYPNPKIKVLFNDMDPKNIEDLKSRVNDLDLPDSIEILYGSKSFADMLADPEIENIINQKIPKFFFLDPFGYSSIESVDDLKKLMGSPYPGSEILLFIPTFHAYRFTDPENKLPPKLINFLNNFTSNGVYDYSDIYEFNNSIKEKLKESLSLKLVRPVLIDVGRSKNTLFFITKNYNGMLLINKEFLKKSDDGKRLLAKELKQKNKAPQLFKKCQIEKQEFGECIGCFYKDLEKTIKEKNSMSNDEIVRYSIEEGYVPKYASDFFKSIKDKIDVKYIKGGKKGCLYISEANIHEKICTIAYKG